jgi:polysaccharide export outer membrane protein
MTRLASLFLGALLLCILPLLKAAESSDSASTSGYKLFPRDLIAMSILGEPDMTIERRIDGDGRVSLPLIGSVSLRGLSTTEAENKIRQVYIERQIYIRPQVSLSVKEYYPREVFVLGQVRTPGKITLPIEASSISIVEAISKAGGFTRISKGDSVQVTRKLSSGAEQSTTVDVAGMIDGKGTKTGFIVQPDDVIFVPERLF